MLIHTRPVHEGPDPAPHQCSLRRLSQVLPGSLGGQTPHPPERMTSEVMSECLRRQPRLQAKELHPDTRKKPFCVGVARQSNAKSAKKKGPLPGRKEQLLALRFEVILRILQICLRISAPSVWSLVGTAIVEASLLFMCWVTPFLGTNVDSLQTGSQ